MASSPLPSPRPSPPLSAPPLEPPPPLELPPPPLTTDDHTAVATTATTDDGVGVGVASEEAVTTTVVAPETTTTATATTSASDAAPPPAAPATDDVADTANVANGVATNGIHDSANDTNGLDGTAEAAAAADTTTTTAAAADTTTTGAGAATAPVVKKKTKKKNHSSIADTEIASPTSPTTPSTPDTPSAASVTGKKSSKRLKKTNTTQRQLQLDKVAATGDTTDSQSPATTSAVTADTPATAAAPTPDVAVTDRDRYGELLSNKGWHGTQLVLDVPVDPTTAVATEPAAAAAAAAASSAATAAAATSVPETKAPKRADIGPDDMDEYGFRTDEAHASDPASVVPPAKIRERTIKWIDMFKGKESKIKKGDTFKQLNPWSDEGINNFRTFFQAHRVKVTERCYKGVPRTMRGIAWFALAGADTFKSKYIKAHPDYVDYTELINTSQKLEILDVIDRDIDRCYPTHVAFRNRDGDKSTGGQTELEYILKAYAFYNPEIGYCQGMGMLAGMMLMHMTAENSFWLLVATLENYAKNFFDPNLSQIKRMATVFQSILLSRLPKVAKHLDDNGMDPLMYVTPWFMTFFTTTLPWATVLRIWDMFFCEGVQILLQVALAIMQIHKDEILKQCPTLQELMQLLLHLPLQKLQPSTFVDAVHRIKFQESELEGLRLASKSSK